MLPLVFHQDSLAREGVARLLAPLLFGGQAGVGEPDGPAKECLQVPAQFLRWYWLPQPFKTIQVNPPDGPSDADAADLDKVCSLWHCCHELDCMRRKQLGHVTIHRTGQSSMFNHDEP